MVWCPYPPPGSSPEVEGAWLPGRGELRACPSPPAASPWWGARVSCTPLLSGRAHSHPRGLPWPASGSLLAIPEAGSAPPGRAVSWPGCPGAQTSVSAAGTCVGPVLLPLSVYLLPLPRGQRSPRQRLLAGAAGSALRIAWQSGRPAGAGGVQAPSPDPALSRTRVFSRVAGSRAPPPGLSAPEPEPRAGPLGSSVSDPASRGLARATPPSTFRPWGTP